MPFAGRVLRVSAKTDVRMTAEHEIDYDALAQAAMRGVVRAVLTRVQKSGLPGDHHFYIAFDTRHPGVVLSKRLKTKYADEMTIVLQHVFWDLIVSDVRFEVKLRFDGVPERLVIPFDAVKVFFDPSVPYGLQFDEAGSGRDAGSVVGINEDGGMGADTPSGLPPGMQVPALTRDGGRPVGGRSPAAERGERKRPVRRVRSDKDDEGDAIADNVVDGSGGRREPQPATSRTQPVLAPVPSAPESDAHAATPSGPDNVISLDRFRKKP
jgi:hypothetical protein